MAYARQSHVTLDERNQYLPILYRIYAAGEHVTWSSVSEELKSLFYRHVFHDEEQVALVYNHRYLLAIAGYADDLLARREQLFRDSRRFQEEIPPTAESTYPFIWGSSGSPPRWRHSMSVWWRWMRIM